MTALALRLPAFFGLAPALLCLAAASSAGPGPKRTAAPTFARDIAPILYARCAPCHRPGEVAPFSLLTYEDAKKRARLLAAVTAKGVMPPWKPQPGHGEFRESRLLPAAEKAALAKWAEAGGPAGDLKTAPAPPVFREGWKLGPPDMILKMSEAFPIPAEGPDVYQHFVFSLGAAKERYLRAIEIRPGNRRVAHHAVGLMDGSGTARKLDAKTPEPGYPGMGGPGFLPVGFTPGYVPGQTPRPMADDSALTLPRGADYVLQMHYHPTGKPETDRTEVGLYFTDRKPTRPPNMVLLGSNDIDIRAGDAAYTVSDSFKLPVDMTVGTVWAHMHMIGKKVRVWAEMPGGETRPLLLIDDWDFNWQDTYVYAAPFRLPAGTVIRSEFTFDNSDKNPRNPNSPPRRVLIGENSTDEMAGLILGGHTDNGLADLALLAANVGHYFEMQGKGSRAEAEAKKVREKAKETRPDVLGMVLFRGGASGGAGLIVELTQRPVAFLCGLVLFVAGVSLFAALLLPGATGRAARALAATPWRCFGRGVAALAVLPLAALALLFAEGRGAQGFGLLIALGLSAAFVVGSGGLARLAGGRIARRPAEGLPVGGLAKGGLACALAALFPVVGWLVLAPLALACAAGAGLSARPRRSPWAVRGAKTSPAPACAPV